MAALGLTMEGDYTYPCCLEDGLLAGGLMDGVVTCGGGDCLGGAGLRVGEGDGLLLMIP